MLKLIFSFFEAISQGTGYIKRLYAPFIDKNPSNRIRNEAEDRTIENIEILNNMAAPNLATDTSNTQRNLSIINTT